MDPLEQKSKMQILMELMKAADDADSSRLGGGPKPDIGMGVLSMDKPQASDESVLSGSKPMGLGNDVPMDGSDGDDSDDSDALKKLMEMYESLK